MSCRIQRLLRLSTTIAVLAISTVALAETTC
jgi:hypothetical protein